MTAVLLLCCCPLVESPGGSIPQAPRAELRGQIQDMLHAARAGDVDAAADAARSLDSLLERLTPACGGEVAEARSGRDLYKAAALSPDDLRALLTGPSVGAAESALHVVTLMGAGGSEYTAVIERLLDSGSLAESARPLAVGCLLHVAPKRHAVLTAARIQEALYPNDAGPAESGGEPGAPLEPSSANFTAAMEGAMLATVVFETDRVPSSLPALLELLEVGSRHDRLVALIALQSLGRDAAPAAGPLRRFMDGCDDGPIREYAGLTVALVALDEAAAPRIARRARLPADREGAYLELLREAIDCQLREEAELVDCFCADPDDALDLLEDLRHWGTIQTRKAFETLRRSGRRPPPRVAERLETFTRHHDAEVRRLASELTGAAAGGGSVRPADR